MWCLGKFGLMFSGCNFKLFYSSLILRGLWQGTEISQLVNQIERRQTHCPKIICNYFMWKTQHFQLQITSCLLFHLISRGKSRNTMLFQWRIEMSSELYQLTKNLTPASWQIIFLIRRLHTFLRINFCSYSLT